MTASHTTDQNFVALMAIGVEMSKAGLAPSFIAAAVEGARENEGLSDLMHLWSEASAKEKSLICADIQEVLEDLEDVPEPRDKPPTKPRIASDDLDNARAAIRPHKERLRVLIDRHGGVSEVARKSGMLQPSLSRMLNSGSMPRRTTLYKIAAALDLTENEVTGEWVR